MFKKYAINLNIKDTFTKLSGKIIVGRDSVVDIATCLSAGRFGDRIPLGGEIFRTLQTSPSAHPAPYVMDTGSFPEVKRLGVGLNTHPNLGPRLKKEYSSTSTQPLGLRDLF
jgi:hypothetical protein